MFKDEYYVAPVDLKQLYNIDLLSRHFKINDDSETFYEVYLYIKKHLFNKANYHPKWRERCEVLEKEFLELYERAKEKEEKSQGCAKNKTQKPFYRISFLNRSYKTIFDGLRRKSKRYTS